MSKCLANIYVMGVNYMIESSHWSVAVLVNNSIIKLVGVGQSFSSSQLLPQNGGGSL